MDYRRILTIAAMIAVLSGCKTQPNFEAVYTRISAPSIQSGQSIPSPQKKSLITITGKIKAQQAQSTKPTTQPDRIEMDRSVLEAIGLVEYEIKDLFELTANRFRGVLMRDLLNLCQASPDATQVTMTALNDYKITIPIEVFQKYPVVLALQQNGEVMKPDYRGPAMIVTPHEQYPGVEPLQNRNNWIWQVAKIHIE
jgi:hypothetical protein